MQTSASISFLAFGVFGCLSFLALDLCRDGSTQALLQALRCISYNLKCSDLFCDQQSAPLGKRPTGRCATSPLRNQHCRRRTTNVKKWHMPAG
ncbi:hypothetical protein FFLO_03371 [Filobasidium floriforme]|uniref:Secreted protein n=1 Tax=Filobasidium floriforme TaxID=5210 RepID=A0A8K0JR78_9TREE|nr:uncharacterized protein HD553DRAFT_310089 [Filobasidium floriforme]KAG7544258.1 hypothetical protein FFLO_03371 [Filobasidium floriforme]KAH8085715.1 hypothetical protein HD553DRAFT_310089 [Filobasidium floriforme]